MKQSASSSVICRPRLRSRFKNALNNALIDINPFDRFTLAKILKQATKTSEYEVAPLACATRQGGATGISGGYRKWLEDQGQY